ncbi:hypothetical protein IWQ57_003714 [Coemansia nantahalensis]|uniref:Uncharacterized protein n=1 Tax=Coemansia nantahalensis TaxID=2789366 RepID=A0ACC1JVJ8_9FUNG|nr:hypothetical protein IWQ57_003714 [Coemansia nantahalensis]
MAGPSVLAPLRILSTSTAGNLVAEVARDTVERHAGDSSTAAQALYQLGHQAAVARLRAGGAQLALLGPMVAAAGDSNNAAAAAQFVAGVAEAVVRGGAAQTPVGERVWAVFAGLAAAADAHALGAVAAAVAEAGLADRVRQLARGGALLRTVAVAAQPELAAALVDVGTLHDARWAADQAHCAAVAMLVAQEQCGAVAVAAPAVAQALALARVAESVARRSFVDPVGVPPQALVPLWCTVADALASAHYATLAHGRAGPESFRCATTALVRFMTDHGALADAAVRQLFDMQPCLRFLAHRPADSVAHARSCVVLFYLDLIEHLAGSLRPETLRSLVLPLAAKYAEAAADRGWADWFESAHAVLLACLESGAVHEIVPWYTRLLLRRFPDAGITAELLRIAYTAAVRSVAARESPPALAAARECIARLVDKLNEYAPSAGASRVATAVSGVHRRELLGVLALQLAAVPMQMLPQLMAEVHERAVQEPDPAAQRALLEDIQRTILEQADLPRKPALSTWVWQLLSTAANAAN